MFFHSIQQKSCHTIATTATNMNAYALLFHLTVRYSKAFECMGWLTSKSPSFQNKNKSTSVHFCNTQWKTSSVREQKLREKRNNYTILSAKIEWNAIKFTSIWNRKKSPVFWYFKLSCSSERMSRILIVTIFFLLSNNDIEIYAYKPVSRIFKCCAELK